MLQVQQLQYHISSHLSLKHIDFEAREGEFVAILGANGAGKSTLLKLISGSLLPHQGTVCLNEMPLPVWHKKERSRFVAVLQQQNPLQLPFSVQEVVMMGRYPHFGRKESIADYERVEEALTQTDILHLRERNYLTLSGGEQQRVHLARVLAQVGDEQQQSSRFLFMDEPSNNLDIKHQHKILQVAQSFAAKGNCVVAVLHDLNLALQYADKFLLLKGGRQLAFGSINEILNKDTISEVYDIPLSVFHPPMSKYPMVIAVN